MSQDIPLNPTGIASSASPLAGSPHDLYAVYVEVAKRDHACRRAALYGSQTPPAGHTPFRPLPFEDFQARFLSATKLRGLEDIFRRQLARQAEVYGVLPSGGTRRQAA